MSCKEQKADFRSFLCLRHGQTSPLRSTFPHVARILNLPIAFSAGPCHESRDPCQGDTYCIEMWVRDNGLPKLISLCPPRTPSPTPTISPTQTPTRTLTATYSGPFALSSTFFLARPLYPCPLLYSQKLCSMVWRCNVVWWFCCTRPIIQWGGGGLHRCSSYPFVKASLLIAGHLPRLIRHIRMRHTHKHSAS